MTDDRTPERQALDAHYAAVDGRERDALRVRPLAREVLAAVLTADPRELPESVRGPVTRLMEAMR